MLEATEEEELCNAVTTTIATMEVATETAIIEVETTMADPMVETTVEMEMEANS